MEKLTEQDLKDIELLADSGFLYKASMKRLVSNTRTLEQQNKQLTGAVETAIMWMQGAEMHIKAGQLRQALQSIQGDK